MILYCCSEDVTCDDASDAKEERMAEGKPLMDRPTQKFEMPGILGFDSLQQFCESAVTALSLFKQLG
jgi:hypothetical protein